MPFAAEYVWNGSLKLEGRLGSELFSDQNPARGERHMECAYYFFYG